MTEILHSKRPDSEIFRIHNENWTDAQFDELLVAQGLFDQKYIIILDSLFDEKTVKERILDRVKDMKESENVFLIIEGETDKKTLDKLSKYADKVQEFDGGGVQEERFNTFGLADAFGRRDKKSLWVGYLQAIDRGISPEEISGVLPGEKEFGIGAILPFTGMQRFFFQLALQVIAYYAAFVHSQRINLLREAVMNKIRDRQGSELIITVAYTSAELQFMSFFSYEAVQQ